MLVESHGGHATVVSDVPVRFGELEPFPLPNGFNLAVVCSFNPDEPIAQILAAARQLADVNFHVTGNPSAAGAALKENLPANVSLTGFLSDAEYAALISTADAVMALTTRDHTMLRAAWEAVYQSTPVIVSDWPTLRESFDSGAVHVDNTVDGIVRGVREMQQQLAGFHVDVRELRERKERRWIGVRDALLNRLSF
jgi:hypothetical protein